MDKTTSGLDSVSRDELLKTLLEYIEDGKHSVLVSTHITGDLKRAADYITYINYGALFFSGSKDELVDMFRLVKGGRDELTSYVLVLRQLFYYISNLDFRDFSIDFDRHLVEREGADVNLTATEFAILQLLAQNPGMVFSK